MIAGRFDRIGHNALPPIRIVATGPPMSWSGRMSSTTCPGSCTGDGFHSAEVR
jgi:hypothetical protein